MGPGHANTGQQNRGAVDALARVVLVNTPSEQKRGVQLLGPFSRQVRNHVGVHA